MSTILLFAVFLLLLVISATPLLGSMQIKWSLNLMIILSAIFFVMGWVLFICYPMFS